MKTQVGPLKIQTATILHQQLKRWQNSSSLMWVFRDFRIASLKSIIFPSLFMLIQIGVTIPVSSCSPERSFSKLKLIKTSLRSTM